MKETAIVSLVAVQILLLLGCKTTQDPFVAELNSLKPEISKEEQKERERLRKEWEKEQKIKSQRRIEEREILNQFILDDFTFDWTPLAEVLAYVQSEVNKQSDDHWEFRIYQTISDIESFGYLGVSNEMKYKGTFRGPIGVGDFFLFLNQTTSTKYEIQGNVIYFSRRWDVSYIWD